MTTDAENDIKLISRFGLGNTVVARASNPLIISGNNNFWIVQNGAADIFMSQLNAEGQHGRLYPVGRCETGHTMWGLPDREKASGWVLLAIGNSAARIEEYSVEQFMANDSVHWPLLALKSNWLRFIAKPLVKITPGNAQFLKIGVKVKALADSGFSFGTEPVWAKVTDGFKLFGQDNMTLPAGTFPLPLNSWLMSAGKGELTVIEHPDPLSVKDLISELENYISMMWRALISQTESKKQIEVDRLMTVQSSTLEHMSAATGHLTSMLDAAAILKNVGSHDDNDLFAACTRLGHYAGIEFVKPPGMDSNNDEIDWLAEICESSQVRKRQVSLSGSWWKEDGLPLLCFNKNTGSPIPLIPSEKGYCYLNESAKLTLVTPELVANLERHAWIFYRSLGDLGSDLIQLIKFGSLGASQDYWRIGLMSLAVGLIGLIIPIATGSIFDTIIPGADKGQMFQIALALVAAGLAAGLFEATRAYATLRVEGRLDIAIQSGIWDKLVRLPAPFFRQYSSGDLAMRANGVITILRVVSGSTLQTLMSAVFSTISLALLFYYSVKLALVALFLVILAVSFMFGFGYLKLVNERKVAQVEGEISGFVFQMLSAISKLRSSGAESRAFLRWSSKYGSQQAFSYKARRAGVYIDIFNSIFPTFCNLAIFFTIAFYLSADVTFGTGQFMAFTAAFTSFLTAMIAASSALMSVLSVIPTYERALPILDSIAEVNESKTHPGVLSGSIEINRLNFKYDTAGPYILRDFNLKIGAGEFVALVGGSGSGKSTLLRLLLGFEKASQGAIYYDNKNLSDLDVVALRRQLGVVLQNGQLMTGDIFSNITGSSLMSQDDAWLAAESAGVADDIRAMPMGMFTMVSEGGSTLSGGQRQRVMIARAIAHRPRILFFDEATSALDNNTQSLVTQSLDRLNATRIVIAHRLSTVINADRIIVMESGRIVEMGTYEQLMLSNGSFAELARRQMS
jgi:ATP-binding cassette subfamily C protein